MPKFEKSRRFLNAFVDIEQTLDKIVKNRHYTPFYQLVDAAARTEPFIQDIAVELKEYGDLRNAIVHERIDDQPIAEPHEVVVLRLEKIRDLLQSPPLVEDTFLRSVVTCKLEDPLSSAVKKMRDNSFSKLPVYQSETFVGLLTAEAITFWLADHISFNKDLSAERVEAVVRYMYDVEKYCFVARTSPLFEVLRIFDDYSHQGTRLQAILISDDGSEQSELLGIITVFDLPKIYNIIDGK